jgi:Mor family transcriptional regulator
MSNYLRESRDEAIKELVKKGRTFREIAAIYKISFQRVHQIVNKEEWKKKTGRTTFKSEPEELSSNRVSSV